MKAFFVPLVVVFALVVGFLLGRQQTPNSEPLKQTTTSKSERTTSQPRNATKFDPKSTVELFLNSKGNDRELLLGFTQILEEISLEELKLLNRELQLNENFSNWNQLSVARSLLFQRWAEIDHPSAIQAASSSDTWLRESSFSSIFTVLAAEDPAGAWQIASGLKSQSLINVARQAALGAIALHDPALAFSYYQENPSLPAHELFGNWAKIDPRAALIAVEFVKGTSQEAIRSNIIASLYRKSPEEALAAE